MRGLRPLALLLVLVGVLASACGVVAPTATADVVVGAVYPLSGPQATGGHQELAGVQIALALAGAPFGSGRVRLQIENVQSPAAARQAVDSLIDRYHVSAIVGTYASGLAEAAAAEADRRGVVYWETGAVADDVTLGRRYVFRTVASGATLGHTAADFTAQVLTARAGLVPGEARVAIVHVDDGYGRSVAAGERDEARALGLDVVDDVPYNPSAFDPVAVVGRVAADRPDYLWDVSYLADGVDIWREVVRQRVPIRAAVGTSSAFCMPEFGRQLGAQAVGLFAADKPDQAISSNALNPGARTLLARAAGAYQRSNPGSAMEIPTIAGFVGGWTLFHDVLPAVRGSLSSNGIRAAALAVNVPVGAEINGGGVYFARPGTPDAGQNLLAASDVGEWVAPNQMEAVYPAGYATAEPVVVAGPSAGPVPGS